MPLALHVDRLIDGTGAPPVPDAVLVMEGDPLDDLARLADVRVVVQGGVVRVWREG